MTSKRTWGLTGLTTVLAAAFLIATPAQADDVYAIDVSITETDNEAGTRSITNLSTDIPATSDTKQALIDLPIENGAYKLSARIVEQPDDNVFAEFVVCEIRETKCTPIAEPSIQVNGLEPGEVSIGSVVKDPATGQETPFNLLTIKVAKVEI